VAGIGTARLRLQAGHVATLLIDRNKQPRPLVVQESVEGAQLVAVLDVAGEQDDAAQALRRAPPHPLGRLCADETWKQAAERERLDRGAHPFTEPAVNPPTR